LARIFSGNWVDRILTELSHHRRNRKALADTGNHPQVGPAIWRKFALAQCASRVFAQLVKKACQSGDFAGAGKMAIPRFREHQGWLVLANGFRPFFLLASIQAAVAILVWLPVLFGELQLTSAFAPRDWHIHEMLYGYLPAVITGFLFTAIPNWTGRLPLQGTSLLSLVLVWLAGRLAVTFRPRPAGSLRC
jgi:hypothetical protein